MWPPSLRIRLPSMPSSIKACSSWFSIAAKDLLIVPVRRTFYLLPFANRNCVPVGINNDHRIIHRAIIWIRVPGIVSFRTVSFRTVSFIRRILLGLLMLSVIDGILKQSRSVNDTNM